MDIVLSSRDHEFYDTHTHMSSQGWSSAPSPFDRKRANLTSFQFGGTEVANADARQRRRPFTTPHWLFFSFANALLRCCYSCYSCSCQPPLRNPIVNVATTSTVRQAGTVQSATGMHAPRNVNPIFSQLLGKVTLYGSRLLQCSCLRMCFAGQLVPSARHCHVTAFVGSPRIWHVPDGGWSSHPSGPAKAAEK